VALSAEPRWLPVSRVPTSSALVLPVTPRLQKCRRQSPPLLWGTLRVGDGGFKTCTGLHLVSKHLGSGRAGGGEGSGGKATTFSCAHPYHQPLFSGRVGARTDKTMQAPADNDEDDVQLAQWRRAAGGAGPFLSPSTRHRVAGGAGPENSDSNFADAAAATLSSPRCVVEAGAYTRPPLSLT